MPKKHYKEQREHPKGHQKEKQLAEFMARSANPYLACLGYSFNLQPVFFRSSPHAVRGIRHYGRIPCSSLLWQDSHWQGNGMGRPVLALNQSVYYLLPLFQSEASPFTTLGFSHGNGRSFSGRIRPFTWGYLCTIAKMRPILLLVKSLHH